MLTQQETGMTHMSSFIPATACNPRPIHPRAIFPEEGGGSEIERLPTGGEGGGAMAADV